MARCPNKERGSGWSQFGHADWSSSSTTNGRDRSHRRRRRHRGHDCGRHGGEVAQSKTADALPNKFTKPDIKSSHTRAGRTRGYINRETSLLGLRYRTHSSRPLGTSSGRLRDQRSNGEGSGDLQTGPSSPVGSAGPGGPNSESHKQPSPADLWPHRHPDEVPLEPVKKNGHLRRGHPLEHPSITLLVRSGPPGGS